MLERKQNTCICCRHQRLFGARRNVAPCVQGRCKFLSRGMLGHNLGGGDYKLLLVTNSMGGGDGDRRNLDPHPVRGTMWPAATGNGKG